jgi:integrase
MAALTKPRPAPGKQPSGVSVGRPPQKRFARNVMPRIGPGAPKTRWYAACSSSTQRREGARIRELKTNFGKYSLAAVTPDLVGRYRDDRLAQGKANNTVRLELALLWHLFSVAIKEWHIGLVYNPLANIREPRPGEGRNRRLSGREQTLLLAAVDKHTNPMLGWIVRLAIETGMRQSEILGLRRSQIDLERRVVRLTDTKNNAARTVPLTMLAASVLQSALTHPIRPIDTDLVFDGEPGRNKKRRAYQFTKVWNGIKKQTGLLDFRFHDLRHEAVSRLVEAGLSDQEVAAISGHKSMQMLRRHPGTSPCVYRSARWLPDPCR